MACSFGTQTLDPEEHTDRRRLQLNELVNIRSITATKTFTRHRVSKALHNPENTRGYL